MKKRSIFSRVVMVMTLLVVLSNCQRDEFLHRDPLKYSSDKVTGSIPCVSWNWEGASDYMDTQTPSTILKPWANGVSILYPVVIRYDYKSVDGWKLMYNNFNPAIPTPNPAFFALYNQYRGILRFYWWIPSNSYTSSTYIEENITASSGNGHTTSFFNLTGQEISDPSSPKNFSESVRPYAIPSSGGWYVSQYEVGYDYHLPSLTYTDLGIYYTLKYWNISSETLNGSINGSAEGTITTPSSTITSLFSSAAKVAMGIVAPEIFPAAAGLISVLESVEEDGASGIIDGLGSLVSSGTEDDVQQVNLAITLNAALSGTSTSSGSIMVNNAVGMPGLSNATSASGYVPVDNTPLGVFNLPVRPTVRVTSTLVSGQHICPDVIKNSYYTYSAVLDATTLAYLVKTNSNSFNQAVFNVATIGTIHYDILGPALFGEVCGDEDTEIIAGIPLANWRAHGEKYISKFSATSHILYVRVYFDVTPTNGAAKTTIIKTFRANGVAVN